MFGSTVKYAKDVDGLNDRLINMMKTDLRTHIRVKASLVPILWG